MVAHRARAAPRGSGMFEGGRLASPLCLGPLPPSPLRSLSYASTLACALWCVCVCVHPSLTATCCCATSGREKSGEDRPQRRPSASQTSRFVRSSLQSVSQSASVSECRGGGGEEEEGGREGGDSTRGDAERDAVSGTRDRPRASAADRGSSIDLPCLEAQSSSRARGVEQCEGEDRAMCSDNSWPASPLCWL